MNIIVSFSIILVKMIIEWGVASLQLPAKYPQLPALLIGQIQTLIWRIDILVLGYTRVCIPLYSIDFSSCTGAHVPWCTCVEPTFNNSFIIQHIIRKLTMNLPLIFLTHFILTWNSI